MADITQVPTPAGQISGQVMFYSRPEPLSIEAHGTLGLRAMEAPFAFAAGAHVMPLQVSEFGLAALSYPIIFAGAERTPTAILGIRPGENLFVDEAGRFEQGAYMPAFLRRYPFVLAAAQSGEQMIVCIDRDAPMLVQGGDTPLFEGGQLSAFAKGAVDFCSNFETERRRSELFVNRLKELDLFEGQATTFTPQGPDGVAGQPVQIADYFAVSQEKLNALSDADLRDLHSTGALRQIHAHMLSLANWERLINRVTLKGPLIPNA